MTVGFSGLNHIDALVMGYSWTGNTGQATAISYNFNAASISARLAATMQGAYVSAMQQWSNVANLTFSLNSSTSVTTGLYFLRTDLAGYSSGTIGLTELYGVMATDTLTRAHVAIDDRFTNAASVAAGSLGYLTILHEIGHALGLEHPGNYGQGEIAPYLPAGEDNLNYTIMSYYNSASVTQSGNPPSTPMIYDIAAMQYLYGANTSYNSGNTLYSFTGAMTTQTLWDGAGDDTVSAAGASTGSIIDLREGGLYYSYIGQSRVWNAFGANIEHATGSGYNDTIYGNDLANRLLGGAGNDIINGGANSDTLLGGSGADQLNGGLGFDSIDYSTAASGVFVDLNLQLGYSGDATGDTLTSIEGMVGSAYNDLLYGASGGSSLSGGNGNDRLVGRVGVDTLDGGADTDEINYYFSTSGVNINLSTQTAAGGDAAGDVISNFENATGSSTAADTLAGGTGNNLLTGYGGADSLTGAAGNDTLDGGAGDDIFVFAAGAGADSIIGFEGEGSSGGDVITIAGITDFATIQAATSYNSGASTATINLGGGNVITVTGVTQNFISSDFGIMAANTSETLTGTAGSDTLDGGDGNDTLIGGAGADRLIGGSGIDTADYSNAGAAVFVDLTAGAGYTGDAAGDSLSGIENLTGSIYNDLLYGGPNGSVILGGDGNDRLLGRAGADTLDGGNGVDEVNYYYSNAGVNVNLATLTASGGHATGDVLISVENLVGSATMADVLIGQSLNNLIYAYGGDDSVVGGDGNDTLNGGAGADTLDGGNGSDTTDFTYISSGVFVDMGVGRGYTGEATGDAYISIENIIGSSGNDLIYASGAGGIISAADGNDRLLGRGGLDTLDGGNGIDEVNYYYSSTGVSVDLNTMSVSGGDAAGDIILNVESAVGSSTAADTLQGSSGANVLIGYGGTDRLTGLGGNDTLDGGIGNDIFSFGAAVGSDRIVDFEGEGVGVGDVLEFLSASGFTLASQVHAATVYDFTAQYATIDFGAGQLLRVNGITQSFVDSDFAFV